MAISETDVRQAVASNPVWYHTIDLPGASTPGYVDWRSYTERILPADLQGQRALDVGTYDGFWAFEIERRGAREVVAIDLARLEDSDWPPVHRAKLLAESEAFGVELGRGFQIAKQWLGSSVERVPCDVMRLTPEAIGGQVDLAFIGALLLHLRDPVRALENIRYALRPGGRLIVLESISLRETLLHPRTPLARFDPVADRFNWWLPNLRALHHYVWVAGFERAERITRFLHPPARREMRGWYCALAADAPS